VIALVVVLVVLLVAAVAAAVHFARRAAEAVPSSTAGAAAAATDAPVSVAPDVSAATAPDPAAAATADDGPVAATSPSTSPSVSTASSTPSGELLDRLGYALDQLELGVVLWDGRGQEVFRNRVALAMSEARDGHVLVAAATDELLGEAIAGRTVRRVVELFGPPQESFVVSVGPFVEGGVVSGALAVVEDRSLQRRTETVRRDFVANISHELKTPIGALGLLAETLRDEPDPTVVQRLAERMIVEADRVSRTVDDLLELSRIEFGDDAEFEVVDVVSVVAEAESRIASAAEQSGTKVRAEVPPTLCLHGDRRQLVSALFNLLDNAVKYSPEDSEILVEAVDDPVDGVVRLLVNDRGIGVPRRDLDRIFERFYRVDRARSRMTGGTGLGLAIVRHVASNHGGEVLVESTEGVGSTFTLVLPRSNALDIPTPARTSPHEPPSEEPTS
jgi:two-component system sensor histidine kinase SenX3